jgi:hypothetical protein
MPSPFPYNKKERRRYRKRAKRWAASEAVLQEKNPSLVEVIRGRSERNVRMLRVLADARTILRPGASQ